MKVITVAAAILFRGEEIFTVQRGHGEWKGYWEFPGGKKEKGESIEETLIREIKEELDTTITIEGLCDIIEHDYPDCHVRLFCFWCSLTGKEPTLTEHLEGRWLLRSQLDEVNWLPADRDLIQKIKQGEEKESMLFNRERNRKGTASIKWDFQEEDYGISGLTPFSIADADYRTYSPITLALKKRAEHGIFGYTDVEKSYLEHVKGWIERRHDFFIEPDWIVPTSGVVASMSYAIECLTKPGDKIVVQPPVYNPFFLIIESTHRTMVENELIEREDGSYEMNFVDLEEKFQTGVKMFLLCNPQNPVCRVWKQEELEKIAYLCKKYHVLLVSDEIHWDIMLFGNKHTSMGAFKEIRDQLILCTSASKTFNLAGLQTSNFIIPGKEIREKYQEYLFSHYLFHPNLFGLLATSTAYEDGDAWVDAQNEYLTQNAKLVTSFLNNHLPKVKLTKPEGTYLLWMNATSYHKTGEELISLLAKHGVGLNNGKQYGKNYDGYLRMNIACPKSQLIDGLLRIKEAL